MATKLIPVGQKVYKWTFPDDREDKEATIFHIKIMTNRVRLETQLMQATKLIETAEDQANNTYGDNIEKIENADGKTITDRKEIIAFCLDRLNGEQGSELQLAIQGVGDWLDRGIVKN